VLPFSSLAERWRQLFQCYDIVQGYSTDGFLPLLAGTPFFAFEHGTLREIPFRPTPEGRRTALCYRMAVHVFVTNFDCLSHAKMLAPERHTLINHPFDEDHGLAVSGWEPLRQSLCDELRCDVLFFFPTRHDWVKGTGYADKGNDVFLRAFATLRQAGFSVGAVCCEWGANVPQSKALLDELGCSRNVKWIKPLPAVRFERMARAAHCVVDQFVLGSFGGVMFKAMAVGAPVLTYLDQAQLCKQYPERPPVVNCRTEAQIVEAMSRLLRVPEELAAIGASARAWMKRYHSKAATVLSQTRVFESFLASS
jgi:glycosyltransferase involved in cell wall biosynthesis